MRWVRRAAVIVAGLLAVATLPACGQTSLLRPDCDSPDPDTLVTMAQAVPTATMVPCLAPLPAGWSFEDLEVREDRARMELSSDRGGHRALTVTLQHECATHGASRIPSDEAGAQRWERVRRVTPYSGERIYLFDGGCVIYDVRLESPRSANLLNEASLMVDFTTRQVLRGRVADQSDGVITDAP